MPKILFEEIKNNKEILTYIDKGNENLGVLGFTEHSRAHAMKVAKTAGKILEKLGYSKDEINLCQIAGYMHDIGNAVNRNDHAHNGALMAFQILSRLEMDPKDIACVIAAVGNHDEKTGSAVDPVSAAVILADKTDVRRNRVRNSDLAAFDIHDRVNYAAVSSKLTIHPDKKEIRLDIELDDEICSILDYFEIFLERMIMCRRAAELLGMKFKLTANGSKML